MASVGKRVRGMAIGGEGGRRPSQDEKSEATSRARRMVMGGLLVRVEGKVMG